MLDTLSIYFAMYSKAVTANPMLAGFAIYITGIVTYLARNLPLAIWDFIARWSTTSMEINNSGFDGNKDQFNSFLLWFMESKWARWSRNIYAGRGFIFGDRNKKIVGPGLGRHFFFFKGRLFWFMKSSLESSGTETQKERITIRTFGQSHRPLLDLLDQFQYKENDKKLSIHNYDGVNWARITSIEKRSLRTVCISNTIKQELIKNLDRFVNEPQWYKNKGLPYKVTILFTGLPGTGKSSIVKAIASHYCRAVCIMDLSMMSNKSLQQALATIPEKSILLLEDIDAATKITESRMPKPIIDDDDDRPARSPYELDGYSNLTLAGLLNALDGVIPLHDVIVFMTTNHPENLDAALTRKARVDYTYELGPMKNDEIHEYIQVMYPDARAYPEIEFDPVIGCEVQAAFMESADSAEHFIQQLPHRVKQLRLA